MRMVWNILRVRIWLIISDFRNYSPRQKLINGGFFALLILGAGYALNWLGHRLSGPEGTGMLAALLPSAIIALFFFVLIQLADILYRLFLSPDLSWLLRAPLRNNEIFIAKLIECSAAVILPLVSSLAVMITLGIAQSAPLLFYPLALILVSSMALMATSIGMLFVFLIAALIRPQRLRELLPVGLGLASIGGIIAQQWMLRSLAAWQPLMQALMTGLLDIVQMALITAVSGIAASLMILVTFFVFRAVYFSIFSRLQVSAAIQTSGRKRTNSSFLSSGIIPASIRPIIEKEWIELIRDPRRVTNLILIPMMTVVLLIPMLKDGESITPLLFWMVLIYTGLFQVNSGESTALSSFMVEGTRFVFFRVSPVSLLSVLWGKFWVSYLPTTLPWMLVFIIGGWLGQFPLWQVAALIASMFLGLSGVCLICTAISAQEANFTTQSPSPKLAGASVWVALGLTVLWELFVILLTCGCIFQWAGSSNLVRSTVNIAHAIPILGSLLADGGLPFVFSGLAGIAAFVFLIRKMWKDALHRLEKFEMV